MPSLRGSGGGHTSEHTPLIAKEVIEAEAIPVNQHCGRVSKQLPQIYFFISVLGGSIIFFFISYLIYSSFIVGAIVCSSGVGTLTLKNVIVSDLKDDGILAKLDSNDPYILFQYDGINHQTSVFEDAGTDASWRNLDLPFSVSQSSIDMRHKFRIVVLDHNIVISDEPIGRVVVYLSDYVPTVTKQVQVFSIPKMGDPPLELVDNDNRVQGMLSIDFELSCVKDTRRLRN